MLIEKEIIFLSMLTDIIFEGSEKKIDLILKPGAYSLRLISKERISKLVELANAKIVSSIKTSTCDAYILSESSLFVFDRRLIMITCGSSTLIQSALELLSLFSTEQIETFIFKRQKETRPEHQRSSFQEDAKKLSRILPGQILAAGEVDVLVFAYGSSGSEKIDVEIQMKGVVKDWYPAFVDTDFTVAEHFFVPSGYSMNAVSLKNEYATIHVALEGLQINASFQGSFLKSNLEKRIRFVCEKFRPMESKIYLTRYESDISIKEINVHSQKEFVWLPDFLFENAR